MAKKSTKEKKEDPVEEEYGDLEEVEDIEEEIKEEKTKDSHQSSKTVIKDFFVNLQTVSLTDKIFFIQNLRVMIKSGLSLGHALKTIGSQVSNSYFKKILTEVSLEVESGVTFADSLKKYPRVFNDLFVNMVQSGEISGNLEDVLEKLHVQMKRDHDLVAKVKGAMIYPLVVVIAMIGIGTAMMIFVIPKLMVIFEEFNAELPFATRALIALSKFITSNGLIVALVSIVLTVGFIKFARSKKGKQVIHKVILYTPIFGKISKKINLARFCRTTSSLLKTDIPIVRSLEITSLVVSNVYYKRALRKASKKIAKGLPLNKIMADYPKLFPGTVIQMLKVGEESGAVDSVLDEVAEFYEEDINQVMENLPAIIEPVLILVLGLGVGAMAVAVIMPMYSLTQTF